MRGEMILFQETIDDGEELLHHRVLSQIVFAFEQLRELSTGRTVTNEFLRRVDSADQRVVRVETLHRFDVSINSVRGDGKSDGGNGDFVKILDVHQTKAFGERRRFVLRIGFHRWRVPIRRLDVRVVQRSHLLDEIRFHFGHLLDQLTSGLRTRVAADLVVQRDLRRRLLIADVRVFVRVGQGENHRQNVMRMIDETLGQILEKNFVETQRISIGGQGHARGHLIDERKKVMGRNLSQELLQRSIDVVVSRIRQPVGQTFRRQHDFRRRFLIFFALRPFRQIGIQFHTDEKILQG